MDNKKLFYIAIVIGLIAIVIGVIALLKVNSVDNSVSLLPTQYFVNSHDVTTLASANGHSDSLSNVLTSKISAETKSAIEKVYGMPYDSIPKRIVDWEQMYRSKEDPTDVRLTLDGGYEAFMQPVYGDIISYAEFVKGYKAPTPPPVKIEESKTDEVTGENTEATDEQSEVTVTAEKTEKVAAAPVVKTESAKPAAKKKNRPF